MTANLGLINDVQLRFLCPDDVAEVKRLCREWFPIESSKYETRKTYPAVLLRYPCNNLWDSGILEYSYRDNYHVAYILSIGVAKDYRRQKIGSLLLDSLISNLTTPEQQDCKAMYLHVLSSNTAAIRFYETRCFRRFSHLPMYYAINGAHRDGCLYVFYINGGKPPWTLSYPYQAPLVLSPV
ncbi:hypothetical protein QZH41_011626 [Actinostola sp. cb2023]|nr:hypothetical protein QZH41_011626 [Actinostola sp. cb2023]